MIRSTDVETIKRKTPVNAYLWVECGDGCLRKIDSVTSDYWIVTGTGWDRQSYCCHSGSMVILCDTTAEKDYVEAEFQKIHAERLHAFGHTPWGDIPQYPKILSVD